MGNHQYVQYGDRFSDRKMQNEPFLQNVDAINEMKLRVSYGSTGNQGIDPLESLGVADDVPYVFGGETVAGTTPSSRLPNPDLKWETTNTFNTGIDFQIGRCKTNPFCRMWMPSMK